MLCSALMLFLCILEWWAFHAYSTCKMNNSITIVNHTVLQVLKENSKYMEKNGSQFYRDNKVHISPACMVTINIFIL